MRGRSGLEGAAQALGFEHAPKLLRAAPPLVRAAGAVLWNPPAVARELIALVKHDCPVCDELLPALDATGVRIVSQSSPDETVAQARRLGLSRVPEVDA